MRKRRLTIKAARAALAAAGLPATPEDGRALRDLVQVLRDNPVRVQGREDLTRQRLLVALDLAGFEDIREEPYPDWDLGPGVYAIQARHWDGLGSRATYWHFSFTHPEDGTSYVFAVTPARPWWKRTIWAPAADWTVAADQIKAIQARGWDGAYVVTTEDATGLPVVMIRPPK